MGSAKVFRRSNGASMVEFAIFVPFLIILFFGLVELGRLLSEYTWVAQATYQTAMLGSETSLAIRNNAMEKRKSQLKNLQGSNLEGELVLTPQNEEDPNNRYVRVSLQGRLFNLLNSNYGLNLNVSAAAPILLMNSDLPVNLETPQDSGCVYSCEGTPICCDGSCAAARPANCGFAPKPNDPGPAWDPNGDGSGGGGWGGGGGGGGCFVADTAVLMADGTYRAIQTIQPGEMVASYNSESGAIEPNVVTTLYVHDSDRHLLVNNHLGVTANHPMLHDGSWVHMGALRRGSTLTSKDRGKVRIRSIERVNERSKIYNLEVVPNHTYIVSGEHIVVHNEGRRMVIKAE